MKLLTLLKKLEWSGTTSTAPSYMGADDEGSWPCCPCCRGAKPSQYADREFMEEYIGHRKNCELVKAMLKLKAVNES